MRSKIIVVVALFVFPVLCVGQSSAPASYINYEFENVLPETTLPNGVKYLGGGLIGDIDADPVYGISELQQGKTKMLWLKVSTGQDHTGVKGWKVLDVLSFSLAASDYLFFYGDPGIDCRRGGVEISNLVGIGRINRGQGIFRPSKLWIANIEKRKFEPIALAGVKCGYSEP